MAKQEVTFLIRARDHTRGVFRRIRRSLISLRGALGGLLSAAAITAAARAWMSYATQIGNMADRLGISTERAQALREQFKSVGVEGDQAVNALQRIQMAGNDAVRGNAEMADAWERLGITVDQLANSTGTQKLLMLAEGFKEMGRNPGGLRALERIGGEDLLRAIPLLQKGGFQLAEEMRALEDMIALGDARIRSMQEKEEAIRRDMMAAQKELSEAFMKYAPEMIAAMGTLTEALTYWREGGPSAADRDLMQRQLYKDTIEGTIVEDFLQGIDRLVRTM